MASQHLDSLKELLNLDDASAHGQFGIYVNEDERRDEYYYIGANKEGLRLFAYQLPCAAADLECHDREGDARNPIIGLYPEKNPWVREDSVNDLCFCSSSAISEAQRIAYKCLVLLRVAIVITCYPYHLYNMPWI